MKINLHVESPLIFQLLRWTLCGSVPGLRKSKSQDNHQYDQQGQDHRHHHLWGPADDPVEGDGAALLSLTSMSDQFFPSLKLLRNAMIK